MTPLLYSRNKRFSYIGVEKCSEKCHSSDAIGNQYKKWLASPHARAYLVLKTKQAQIIAQRTAITSPEKNTACLRCHTTGRGKYQSVATEGVGCEACHGPGNGYYRISDHVNFMNRKQGYTKAIKNGMYPVLSIIDGHIKKREKLCLSCHTIERPCLPENERNKYSKKLTIQTIDTLKKGDVVFKHPLRK